VPTVDCDDDHVIERDEAPPNQRLVRNVVLYKGNGKAAWSWPRQRISRWRPGTHDSRVRQRLTLASPETSLHVRVRNGGVFALGGSAAINSRRFQWQGGSVAAENR
jgi:hypothetical protein